MINENQARKYCKEDISKIKNYELAMNDTTQTWHCHHILGEILSRAQLKDHDFYYNVPACMLKFVTETEHISLHKKGKKRKPFTEETRKKISESHKGRIPWNKGKKNIYSEDTLKKLSAANKGHITKGSSGMHWYNNGVENILTYTCPDGYIKGRLK